AAEVGVVLPQPGSEQFVLLPAQNAGLRLVRLPGDEPRFLAELYGPNAEQPLSRTTITGIQSTLLMPLSDGSDAQLALELTRTTGVDVQIRRTPGLWLLVPGLLLALAGLLPLWKRPAFLLAEVMPWPPHVLSASQSAVTLSGSTAAQVAATATAAGVQLPPEPPDA
ncbi:MAG: hypothetical protein ACRC1H_18890, partial [Caldilineaceae bacterium]